jgi:hypothetical protein
MVECQWVFDSSMTPQDAPGIPALPTTGNQRRHDAPPRTEGGAEVNWIDVFFAFFGGFFCGYIAALWRVSRMMRDAFRRQQW